MGCCIMLCVLRASRVFKFRLQVFGEMSLMRRSFVFFLSLCSPDKSEFNTITGIDRGGS